ncbi:MAG: hypothetical protein DMG13_20905, partial [Acidobacteria bacterium]
MWHANVQFPYSFHEFLCICGKTTISAETVRGFLMRIIVTTALILCVCGAAKAEETALYFDSSPNDYIGGGQQRYHSPPQVTFTATSNTATSRISFNVNNFNASPSIWWYLDLASANNAPLVPGRYPNAVRYPFQDPSQNGLSFSGEGRGCNTLTGEFTVLEAVFGSGGSVVRFAADFIQHCEGGIPAVYGGIRYNSTIINPVPVLNSVSPSNVPAGAAFTLRVDGSNFIPGSYVRWNGIGRPTTLVSNSQMTAAIPIGDVASSGTADVTVFNPGQGGGSSNSVSVTITNPIPTLTSLGISAATAGSPGFTLTVRGTNFIAGSSVLWNGSPRTTTFGTSSQLTATILAEDLANVGAVPVTVFNPAPGGGVSNSLTFNIVNPPAVVTSLVPSSAIAGGETFSLTVNGSNFIAGSVVQWNRNARPTTVVSNTRLVSTISASDIAVAGTAQVSVVNPAPGGGSSVSLLFTIGNPIPVITSLAPTSVTAGGPAFALTVNGSNFLPGSVVRWNGSNRPTLVSSTRLVAAIGASDISNPGSVQITVLNPGPGGGISNSLGFNIDPVSNNSYPYVYYFAQIAVGGGWQTALTYVNYSPQNVVCQTSFSATSGVPLTVPFAGVAASSRTDAIAAGGTLHQESNADAGTPVATGWAQARCSGPIKSSVLFRSYQNGIATAEASVSGTLPASKFVSFANSLTGIAYANPSTEPAVITFRALDSSGNVVGTANLTLAPAV